MPSDPFPCPLVSIKGEVMKLTVQHKVNISGNLLKAGNGSAEVNATCAHISPFLTYASIIILLFTFQNGNVLLIHFLAHYTISSNVINNGAENLNFLALKAYPNRTQKQTTCKLCVTHLLCCTDSYSMACTYEAG